MGQPLPQSANPSLGAPPAGDQANAVVTGTLTGAGKVSQPFVFYGAFNLAIYASVTATLTTTAGSTGANVSPAAGIGPGESVKSSIVPPGTTILSGGSTSTSVSLGGLTTAQIAAIANATDATAIFVGTALPVSATVNLERSFDGGSTWVTCTIPNSTTLASYVLSGTLPQLSISINEPEKGVAYRLNCVAYASGTINYRFSETGSAATTWAPNL